MSKQLVFQQQSWEDYLYWLNTDKKILFKINELIRDIQRNDNVGLGKPEALKNELSGYWSRRFTGIHRLVYRIDEDNIYIAKCRGHYDD